MWPSCKIFKKKITKEIGFIRDAKSLVWCERKRNSGKRHTMQHISATHSVKLGKRKEKLASVDGASFKKKRETTGNETSGGCKTSAKKKNDKKWHTKKNMSINVRFKIQSKR